MTASPDVGASGAGRGGRSRFTSGVILTAKIAVTAVVVGYIIRRFGWGRIVDTLRDASSSWLAAALLLFFVSALLGVVQWRRLLHSRGVALTAKRAFVLYFIGLFFNNFIFGTAAGDALRVAYVKLGTGSARSGLAATFLDRFAGLCIMLIYAAGGSAFLLQRGLVSGTTLVAAVLSLACALILFFGVFLFLISRRLQNLFFGVFERVPFAGGEAFRSVVMQALLEAKDRRLLWEVTGLSAVIQALRVGVHILCGVSLGLVTPDNIHFFFVFVPILAVLMTVPLPFGIREGVGGALFALAGFPVDAALVMEFLASVVGILASSVGAICFVGAKTKPSIARYGV